MLHTSNAQRDGIERAHQGGMDNPGEQENVVVGRIYGTLIDIQVLPICSKMEKYPSGLSIVGWVLSNQ